MIENLKFVKEVQETTQIMWKRGWNELNGGNISYLLSSDEEKEVSSLQAKESHEIGAAFPKLNGRYILVTGAGKFFRKVVENPKTCLALIRIIDDGTKYEILWGLEDGGKPTSELPTHLSCLAEKITPENKDRSSVVIHCHPTNVIALTYKFGPDSEKFTDFINQMSTECLVVFPEGIAVLDWMVPGSFEIGEATRKQMADKNIVVWPYHGMFVHNETVERAFGIIETVEKAATIGVKVLSMGGADYTISEQNFKDLAKAFNL